MILEIPLESKPKDIRAAYKKQSLIWHPDRNPSDEALQKMQDINEAYLILKDDGARLRFNVEYKKYQKFKHSYKPTYTDNNGYNNKSKQADENYEVQDDILKKWMFNAREQASKLASQTLSEFNNGTKAAWNEMSKALVGFLIVGLISLVILALSNSCN